MLGMSALPLALAAAASGCAERQTTFTDDHTILTPVVTRPVCPEDPGQQVRGDEPATANKEGE
jgi:hypothetical protein